MWLPARRAADQETDDDPHDHASQRDHGRQAIDGLGEVFSNGADRERQDRETEVRDLHAKIGQLTVERDFLAGGLKR